MNPTIIAAIVAIVGTVAAASSRSRQGRECHATEPIAEPYLWPGLVASSHTNPDSVGPARMLQRISGRYILLEVTTEGAGARKWVIERDLTIRPRARLDSTRRVGFATGIIADGRALTLRSGYLDSTLSSTPSTRSAWFRIAYQAPNTLRLTQVMDSLNPDLVPFDEPGPTLGVQEIDANGTLLGRWAEGGISVLLDSTTVGTLLERPRGYFCAWRVPP